VGRHNLSQLLYRCKGLAWAAALERCRGELLEGTRLPDLPEFESWLELERREL